MHAVILFCFIFLFLREKSDDNYDGITEHMVMVISCHCNCRPFWPPTIEYRCTTVTHYDVIFVRTYPNVHCKYRRTLYFSHQSPKMYLFLRIKRRLPTFHHVVIITRLKWSSPANYCAYCGLVWCLVYCQGNRIKWQDQTKVDRQWRVPYGVNPLFKINKQSVKFARQL